jgi:hypothetical protein
VFTMSFCVVAAHSRCIAVIHAHSESACSCTLHRTFKQQRLARTDPGARSPTLHLLLLLAYAYLHIAGHHPATIQRHQLLSLNKVGHCTLPRRSREQRRPQSNQGHAKSIRQSCELL